MTWPAVWALVVLTLVALLPTYVLLGARPVTLFTTPLSGAVLAAVAAELELATTGSIVFWYVVVAVVANGASLLAMASPLCRRRRRRHLRLGVVDRHDVRRRGSDLPWSALSVGVILACTAWFLRPLGNPEVFGDGYAIWGMHALFVYGGHARLLADLKNPAFAYSNQDYPPLVPAVGAVAFAATGHVSLWLASTMTTLLNACALGAGACGLARMGRSSQVGARLVAVGAAGAFVVIGFGLAGWYALGGYADLLWSAAAVGAVVWGVVLPRSTANLATAAILVATSTLTKNEGLAAGIVIALLVAARYVPRPNGTAWWRWSTRLALAGAMAAPGLTWVMLTTAMGIENRFLAAPGHQSAAERVHPIVVSLADNLRIVPVALAVAVLGMLVLRIGRSDLDPGGRGGPWIALAAFTVVLFVTYAFGRYEIHWWLANSVDRTTIFPKLAAYAELALWSTILVSELGYSGGGPPVERTGVPADPVRVADPVTVVLERKSTERVPGPGAHSKA